MNSYQFSTTNVQMIEIVKWTKLVANVVRFAGSKNASVSAWKQKVRIFSTYIHDIVLT